MISKKEKMISKKEKIRLRSIKQDFIILYDCIIRNTEDLDLQERLQYLRFNALFNNQLLNSLLKANEEEIENLAGNLTIAKKIIMGSSVNRVNNLMDYLSGLSQKSKIFSMERIKEKETVAYQNNLNIGDQKFAYYRIYLTLKFSSGVKVDIFPFGEIQKETL